ncbi:4Fe-4S dicluster domain-containing protein [candidate division KSB1 bacterium]
MEEKKGSRSKSKTRMLRRVSQFLFFAIFMFLLFNTEFRGSFENESIEAIRLDYPVSIFLEMDPLVAFTTALATHTIYKKVIWALIIIVGTVIIGRFFCGWICPMGTINHFFSIYKPERKGKKKVNANHYKKWMAIKYYLLFAFIVMSLFTSLQTGLIDPIPFLVRSMTVSILPSLSLALRDGLDYLYTTDIGFFQAIADGGYYIFESNILGFKPLFFHYGWIIGVIFLGILILNRFITRFWCRGICPLGALLGLLSRFSIFGMEKDHSKCDDCNICLLHCQGGCDPQGGVPWRQAECHLCFNCETECPQDVIRFKFFPKTEGSVNIEPDLKRRRVIESVMAGAIALPLLRATSGLDKNFNSRLLRPPGSLEEKDFLARCIRCGECMKVCPTNSVQPTLMEAGLEGIWTPTLKMRIGYCEYNCVLCSTVCPTGAIWELTESEKLGKINSAENSDPEEANPVKIGTAFYDRGRCLPWAMSVPCIVCEEFCPTSPKAIWLEEVEVKKIDGTIITVQQPHLNVDLCVGCGICENVCPVQDKPAVYVTNIGETRSKSNQILLEAGKNK